MSAPRVRLGGDFVVHGVAPGGWTTCGIMHSTEADAFHFVKAIATDDPVDCMACLVQEARGDVETLTIRVPIRLSVPVHVITFVVETEPKK